MRPEIPVLSFICSALLLPLFFLRCIRTSIPATAVLIWLLILNITDGVNAIVWADNTTIQIPVWCDITTKLVVAAKVGIPGSLVATMLYLERLASNRSVSHDPRSRMIWVMVELGLSYIFPLIVLFVHFAVQNHRFEIIPNYGCFPAIYPATPAIVLMMGPCFILTVASTLLWSTIIGHMSSLSADRFAVHIESRCTLSSTKYYSRFVVTSALTFVMIVLSLFYVFSPPWLVPFTSWTAARAARSQVAIVSDWEEGEPTRVQVWMIITLTITYLCAAFSVGEEGREIRDMFWGRGGIRLNISPVMMRKKATPKPSESPPNAILGSGFFCRLKSTFSPSKSGSISSNPWTKPITLPPNPSRTFLPLPAATPSRSLSLRKSNNPNVSPGSIELKSGWDEMLDLTERPKKMPSLTNLNIGLNSSMKSISPSGWKSRSPSPNLHVGDNYNIGCGGGVASRNTSPVPAYTPIQLPTTSTHQSTSPISSGKITPSRQTSIARRSEDLQRQRKTKEDDVFMVSTLSYLGSPPAKTLGLNSPLSETAGPMSPLSPLLSPPPAYSSPRRSTYANHALQTSMGNKVIAMGATKISSVNSNAGSTAIPQRSTSFSKRKPPPPSPPPPSPPPPPPVSAPATTLVAPTPTPRPTTQESMTSTNSLCVPLGTSPDDGSSSPVDSVLDAYWPTPPFTTPPLSPSSTTRKKFAKMNESSLKPTDAASIASSSRSASPAFGSWPTTLTVTDENGMKFGYPLCSTVTPPYMRSRPFQGSTIEPVPTLGSSPASDTTASKTPNHRVSGRTTSMSSVSSGKASGGRWSKDRLMSLGLVSSSQGLGYGNGRKHGRGASSASASSSTLGSGIGEVIYMTVVQETV